MTTPARSPDWSSFLAHCPAPLVVFERATGRIVAAAPGVLAMLGPEGPERDARLVAAGAAGEVPDAPPAGVRLELFETGDPATWGARLSPRADEAAVGRALLLAELSPLVAHDLSQPIATVMNWAEGLRLRLERVAPREPAVASLGTAVEAILTQGRRAGELLQGWRRHLRDEPAEGVDQPLGAVLERAARHLRAARPDLSVHWPAPEAALPRVCVDAGLVEAALFGLLRSAGSAGDRRVELVSGPETSPHVVLAIGPAPPTDDDAGHPDRLLARTAVLRCGGELHHVVGASGPMFHLVLRRGEGPPRTDEDRRP